MDPHQHEQDDVLRALVVADAAAVDDFMTVSSFDGTTVMHSGFGAAENGQRDFPMAMLNRLTQAGMLTKTEFLDHGDFRFAVAERGRERLAMLDRGGITQLEAETQRAERAEAQLAALRETNAAVERDQLARRRGRANRLGVVAGAVVVLLAGVALFALSEAPAFRLVVGIATVTGLAGVTFYARAKLLVSRAAFVILTLIHDHS